MTPYRVVVCEDDAQLGEDLARRCREIFAGWSVEAEVQLYASADALLPLYETGAVQADLFLLDIQMQGTDGLTLAQRLYDDGVRDGVIFITGHAEYALAGYDAHPLHYLLKPVSDEALAEALSLAKAVKQPQTMLLQRGRRTLSLSLSAVCYLESQGHNTRIVLSDGERRLFNLPLTEVEAQLPEKDFAHSHKSYLINLAWVDEIDRARVRLKSGVELPVSRNYYLRFQTAFVSYINHR